MTLMNISLLPSPMNILSIILVPKLELNNVKMLSVMLIRCLIMVPFMTLAQFLLMMKFLLHPMLVILLNNALKHLSDILPTDSISDSSSDSPDTSICTATPSDLKSLPDAKPLFSIPKIKFDGIDSSQLIEMQQTDDSLAKLREYARSNEKGYFFFKSKILTTFVSINSIEHYVTMLPKPLRPIVLKFGHTVTLALL